MITVKPKSGVNHKRPWSLRWKGPENRNFLILFMFQIKHLSYTTEVFVKQTTHIYFQTVNGLFTTRKRATFALKPGHFLQANHRVVLSCQAIRQPKQ